jgi:VanZ family protein
MHTIFSIVSILYIAGIFILPRVIRSPLLSEVWNPYSLLHIPLYGVLMTLLVLSIGPTPNTLKIANPALSSLFSPGCIATFVGILDEVNQIYIPYRDASVIDVILDILGILLVGILFGLTTHRRKK